MRHCILILVTLLVNPASVGAENEIGEANRSGRQTERPHNIEGPIHIFGDYLQAWVVVYKDFLKTFGLKESDPRVGEYVVSFFEEDEEIIVWAGRNRLASESTRLEKSVKYRVRKSDYQLVDRILLR